jgi:hypothetical protein
MCFSLNLDLNFISSKKIVVGLTSGLIILVVSIVVSYFFQFFQPSIQLEYQNQEIFRSVSDPLMSYFYIEPFLLGCILLWVWGKFNLIIKGDSQLEKGLRFGLIYWIITLPGLVMTFTSFKVSLLIVISWSISNLISAVFSGVLFSKMIK